MPCADCLEQQKILIRLTSALHDRELQNQEVTKKFQKYKLQTKAKFAQLRHQILDASSAEDAATVSRLNNLLLRLDEANDQLLQYRDQIDDLKLQLGEKEKEAETHKKRITTLEKESETKQSGAKVDSGDAAGVENGQRSSSSQLNKDLNKDQTEHMYAQVVYKDAKILELSRIIDEKDKAIMDWQEASRERDEVNKAKTKAIQILQEHLNRYINKKKCDRATETENEHLPSTEKADIAENMASPGGAVAFYKENVGQGKDDDCSSFTTDLATTEMSFDVADFGRDQLPKDKNIDKLNCRLSGLLHQVESMQRRVIKQDLALLDQEIPIGQVPVKKKREKKVKFDFTEQDRLARISELEEKVQKFEQERSDFLQENDELRATISELEQRFDESLSKNDYYEKYTRQLESRLENVERDLEESRLQLEETVKEHKNASLKAKAHLTTKIKELEDELKNVSQHLDEKTLKLTESEENFERLKSDLRLNQISLTRLKEESKKLEAELSAKNETLKILAEKYEKTDQELKETEKNFDSYKESMENLLVEMENEHSSKLKRCQDENDREKSKLLKEIQNLEQNIEDFNQKTTELTFNLRSIMVERDKLSEQKEAMFKDLDQLKEAIEVSNEFIDFLENDLNLSYMESEELRRQLETTELLRETSEYRLKFKAYITKMRVLQKDNENLAEELAKCQENLEKTLKEKRSLVEELENVRREMSVERVKLKEAEQNCVQVSAVYEKSAQDSKDSSIKMKELREMLDEKSVESQNLADQLRQKDQILSSTRHQLETLTNESENYRRQIEGLMEEKQEIESELQKLWRADSLAKKNLAEFEAKYELSNAEKLAVGQQLDEERKLTSDLKRQLESKEALENENLILQDQLNRLGQSVDLEARNALSQLVLCQQAFNESQNRNENLEREIAYLRENWSILSAEKETLQGKINEYSHKIEETKNYADFSAYELQRLQSEYEEYKRKETEEKESIRNEKKNLHQDLTELKNSFEMMESRHQAAENELKEQQTLSENLVEQLNLLSDKLKNTENRVEEILIEKQSIEQLNLDLTNEISYFKSYLRNYEKLKNDYEILENKMASLNQDFAISDQKTQEYASKLDAYEAQIDQLAAEKENLERSNVDLSTEVSSLNGKLDDLNKRLIDSHTLEAQLQGLNGELASLKKDFETREANFHSEKEELKRIIDDYCEEIRKLRVELDQKSQKVNADFLQSTGNDGEINRLESELLILNQKLAEQESILLREREEHQLNVQAYCETIKKLQMELSDKNPKSASVPEIEKLENEIEQNEERIWDLEETLRNERETHKSLMEEHSDARLELEELVNSLQMELDERKTEFEKLTNDNEQLSAKIADLQNRVDLGRNEIGENLQSQYTELLEERNNLSEERHTLCAEIINLNNRLSEIEKDCEIQKSFAERLADNLFNLSNENEALKKATSASDGPKMTPEKVPNGLDQAEPGQKTDWESAYNQLATYYTQLQNAYAALYEQLQQKQPINESQLFLESSQKASSDNTNYALMDVDLENRVTAEPELLGPEEQSFFVENLDDVPIDDDLSKEIKYILDQDKNQTGHVELLDPKTWSPTKEPSQLLKNVNQINSILKPLRCMLQIDKQHIQQLNEDPQYISLQQNWEIIDSLDSDKEKQLGAKMEDLHTIITTIQGQANSQKSVEMKHLLHYIACLLSEIWYYKTESEMIEKKKITAEHNYKKLEEKYEESINVEKLLKDELQNMKQLCLNMDLETNETACKLIEADKNNEEINAKCNDLQNSLNNAENLLDDCKNQITELENQNKDLETMLEDSKTQNRELDTMLENSISEIATLKTSLENAENLLNERKYLTEIINNLHMKLSTMFSQASENLNLSSLPLSEEDSSPEEAIIMHCNDKMAKIEEMFVKLLANNENQEKIWSGKFESTSVELNKANQSLQSLNSEIATFHEEIANLHEEIDCLYDAYRTLFQELNFDGYDKLPDNNGEINMHEKLKNLRIIMDFCFSAMQTASKSSLDNQASYEALQKQRETTKHELNVLQHEYNEITNENCQMNELIKNYELNSKENSETVERLKKDLQLITDDRDMIKEKFASKYQKNELHLKSEVSEMKKQLETAYEKLDALKINNQNMKEESEKLEISLKTNQSYQSDIFACLLKMQENGNIFYSKNIKKLDEALNCIEKKINLIENCIHKKIMEYQKVNRKLIEQNKALTEEIEKIKIDYDNRGNELEITQGELYESEKHCQNLQLELKSLNVKVSEQFNEIGELKKQCLNNEDKQNDQEKLMQNDNLIHLQQNFDALQEYLDTLASSNSILKSDNENLLINFKEEQSKNEQLIEENSEFKDKILQLEEFYDEKEKMYLEEMENHKNLYDSINNKNKSQQEEIEELKRKIDSFETQSNFYKEQIKFLEARVLIEKSVEDEVKKLEQENLRLKNENDSILRANTDFEHKVEVYEAEVQELSQLCNELQHTVKLAHKEIQCNIDNTENEELLAKVMALESRLEMNKEQMNGVSQLFVESELLNKYEKENENLKHEIEQLKKENKQLTTGTKEVAEEFSKVKEEYQKRISELKQDIKEMNKENQHLLSTNKEKDIACEKYISDIHNFEIKLIEKSKVMDNLQKLAENELSLKNQLIALQHELTSTKNDLVNSQKNCQNLKKVIEDMKLEQAGPSSMKAQLKKASQEAKLLVSELEHSRTGQNAYLREIGELKEQLSHYERQLESCRIKLTKKDIAEDSFKNLQTRLNSALSEKQELLKLLSKYEKDMYNLKKSHSLRTEEESKKPVLPEFIISEVQDIKNKTTVEKPTSSNLIKQETLPQDSKLMNDDSAVVKEAHEIVDVENDAGSFESCHSSTSTENLVRRRPYRFH